MAMAAVFVVLVAWPFRPAARGRNQSAANLIFKDTGDGE
jgi:cytochrome c oxidase cbb3-type subunit 4